ncbi:MAG: polysaccharide deacetylase family protein [Acidobacteriota bacterium]|nr:MAG: polysaccharide deacetylase family protein [Acidobacteriota bacterium]
MKRLYAVLFMLVLLTLVPGPVQAQYGDRATADAGKFDWPEGKRGAVSLTFDDGRVSQLENGIPILNKYSVPATFYVHPGPVSERLADWKTAVEAGHEIGNHSNSHPCTGNFPWALDKALENQTLDSIAADIDQASRGIADLLGLVPKTFAFPCGQTFVGRGRNLQSYIPVVAHRFVAARGWLGEGPNNPAFCDLAQLLGMELDGLSFEEARALIDSAMDQGMWLVFAGHDVGESGRQTVLNPTLESICQYVTNPANGIWVDTVAEIATYIDKQRVERQD